jgi:uncharacterized protein
VKNITAESRPGLPRRIVAFPLTLLVIEAVLLVGVAMLASQGLHRIGAPDTALHTLGALLVALAVAGAYLGSQRWIERRPGLELALPGAARELGLGLLAGFVLFSAMTGIVALLGGFAVQGWRGQGQLWALLAMGIVSGTFEEILFRGVLFRHIEAMLGSWAALGLTSVLFGAAHLGNPGATWFSSLAIALEAGILLGAAYMLTRRLWLAIGIHAAWNFTQGWVFSVPVSGGEAPLGLLITRREGPDWLTGGDFGLEASVVALVVATLAGVLMLRRAMSNGRLIAPMWRR